MKLSILLFTLILSCYSCKEGKSYVEYMEFCNDKSGKCWNLYQSERFSIITQFRPSLYNALMEYNPVQLDEIKKSAFDSVQAQYNNMITFKLILSDYFYFKSENPFEKYSVSPEINAEKYLIDNLLLKVNGIEFSDPIITVVSSSNIKYPLLAIVHFPINPKVTKRNINLYIKSLTSPDSLISLYFISSEALINNSLKNS